MKRGDYYAVHISSGRVRCLIADSEDIMHFFFKFCWKISVEAMSQIEFLNRYTEHIQHFSVIGGEPSHAYGTLTQSVRAPDKQFFFLHPRWYVTTLDFMLHQNHIFLKTTTSIPYMILMIWVIRTIILLRCPTKMAHYRTVNHKVSWTTSRIKSLRKRMNIENNTQSYTR